MSRSRMMVFQSVHRRRSITFFLLKKLKNMNQCLRHKSSRVFFSVLMLLVVTIFIGCGDSEMDKNPKGYDLIKGEKFIMPESLLEISGIAFHKGNSDTVYAIQD